MGRYIFRLPDIGEGVAEAEIVAWHVKPGDAVTEDQGLVDVMTDKATVDMTSPVDGVVTAIHGEIGTMLPVGSVLVELEVEGEGNVAPEAAVAAPPPIAKPPVPKPAAAPSEKPAPVAAAAPAPARSTPAPMRKPGETPFAAPATRRRAFELGIPLQFVPGTGPGGRITPEDLDAYVASGGQAPSPAGLTAKTGIDDQRIIGLRRKIAEKMQDAKRRIPHIAYVEECDLTELEALRAEMNASRGDDQPKLTLLPFLMRALVRLRSVNFSLYLKDSDTTLERERPRLGRLGYVCRRTTVRRRQSLTAEHCPLQAAAWSFSLCATQGLAALRGGRGRGGRRRLLLMVLPADHTQPQPRRSALAGVRPVPRAHRRMVRVPPVPARMRRPHVV